MQHKSYDLYAILALFGLAVFSCYQLFWGAQFSSWERGVEPLAKLEQQLNTVKRKSDGLLSWIDASPGDQLKNRDQIFTYENANASLRFTDGTSVELRENTLLRIEKPWGEESSLNVERGVVYAQLNEKAKKLLINLKGKSYLLEGKNAQIQIQGDDKIGKIRAIDGDVRLGSGGESLTLKSGQVLEFDKNKGTQEVQTLNLQAIHPKNSQVLFYRNKPIVKFSWTPTKSGAHFLEVARDYQFKQRFKKITMIAAEYEFELPGEGEFFWRVSSGKDRSGLNSFEVLKDEAPLFLWPPIDTTLLIGEDLFIEWKELHAKEFELKVIHDGNEKKYRLNKSQMHLPNLKVGEYSFAIRVLDSRRPNSPWSNERVVNVIGKRVLKAPLFRLPENRERLVLYRGGEAAKLDLKWANVKGAASYLVEWDIDGEIFSEQVEESHLSLELEKKTALKWRVKPLGDERTDSFFTPWSNANIMIENLETSLPENGARVELKRPGEQVNFEWTGDEKAEYVFEVSKDPNFEEVLLTKRVEGIEVKERFSRIGVYYWRSKVITNDGKVVFSRPAKVTIEKAPPLEAPMLKGKKIKIKLKKKSSSLFKGLLNLIFPAAHADEPKLYAPIEWEEAPEAKAYKLEVFKDPLGTQKIFEVETEDANYEWENVEPGIYYWRMAYRDYWGRLSPFSELSKLEVEYSDNLKQPERPLLKGPTHRKNIALEDSEKVRFRWGKAKRAKKYLFQIGASLQFKEILFEKKTFRNSLDVNIKKLIKRSKYYWRVIAIGELANNKSLRRSFALDREIKVDKKVAREKKALPKRSFLAFSVSPRSVSYELKAPAFSAKIDGVALAGFTINYFKPFEVYELNLEASRKSGEVFETLSYQDLSAKVFLGRPFAGNLNWALGASFRNVSSYALSGTQLADDSETLFGGSGQIFYFQRTSERWAWKFGVEASFGNIFEWTALTEFRRYRKNHHFYFLKAGILGQSYDAATDGEVSTTQIRLDLGYAL